MLGKCLWKCFQHPPDSKKTYSRPTYQHVIDPFVKAIELIPEKRDNRHPDRDPVLEPHYKLVSIVHKLVHGKHISVYQAPIASMNSS